MNLPHDFIARTRALLGDEWSAFAESLAQTPPVSIRLNNKIQATAAAEQVAWCTSGRYLTERPSFTFDPLFHAGAYYVQEASSMFVEQAVKQHITEPVIALDLCAAPGGKSTHLSQILPEGSLIVSNEIVRQRAFVLSENLQKWGNTHNVVTNNAPRDFAPLKGVFDFILIDAPCSGEGMFRKDAASIDEWSVTNVNICAERQRDIVQNVWACLKENGLLVYSTCTYNRDENEENVAWIVREFGAEVVYLQIDPQWQIAENEFGYHFFPHKTRGEGFFLTLIRKKSATATAKFKPEKTQKFKIEFPELRNRERFVPLVDGDQIFAVEERHFPLVAQLKKQLNVLHAGVPMYTVKGKDLIPQTGLALSKAFDANSVATCDLDYNQAIAFLQKEAIATPDSPKGFVVVCYKNTPLGWIKNLGNRSNNLYPTEWRIRTKNNTNNAVASDLFNW